MTIFNSTLNTMKKNINSGQGIIYSIFNGNKISQKDIQSITNYSNALQNGVEREGAWRNNMRSCSVTAQQYVRAAEAAGKSTNEMVAGLKDIPKTANTSQTALKGVAIAGNMLAMMAIGEAISLTIKGIDYLVHYEEKQAEAFKKASESTKQISEDVHSLKAGMSDTASKAKELSSEYAKLVQGVNAFTNENKSLSTKNYERFLELNTQLAELFPSLTKKYDDNGNAILGLSGGVDSVAASIERLVEQQNNLAKIEIRKKLDEYIEGTDDSDGIFKSLEGCNHN